MNIIYPTGLRCETWIVGRDIGVDAYEDFVDPVTKELYALVHFEKGVAVRSVLKKEMYQIAIEKMGEPLSEDALESIADKVMDDLGWATSIGKESK